MPQIYMIVERFKNGDAVAVYRRFRDRGRMAPDGLRYVSSWVNETFTTCYQVMETADRALLDQWIARWRDIVDFEVHPVMTSKEAAQKMEPRLLPEVGAAISAHALPASDRSREN